MSHCSNKSSKYTTEKSRTTCGPVRCLYRSAVGVDIYPCPIACLLFSEICSRENQLISEQTQFGTSNTQLQEFLEWIRNRTPEIVLMESTGVYWISPYEALKRAGFSSERLAIVNAHDIKAVYGRKSDTADAPFSRVCKDEQLQVLFRSAARHPYSQAHRKKTSSCLSRLHARG